MEVSARSLGKRRSSLVDRARSGSVRALSTAGRVRLPPARFGGDEDLDWPGRAVRSVVVASEARSGSTLLCQALGATGLVGLPREYLQPAWFESGHRTFGAPSPTPQERRRRLRARLLLRRQWWEYQRIESATLPAYVDGVVRRRTSGNGVFALKIHWSNYVREQELAGFTFEMLPQPITWIHIQRRDLVAQAVSYVKANQSGVFAVSSRRPRFSAPVHFEDEALVEAFHRVRDGAHHWTEYFDRSGITPIEVTYEELDADYEATIARVLSELGFPDVTVPPAIHVRQADEVNAAWAARFRSLHPELLDDVRPAQP
jgi:trehalose 2-sulfotransferase